jgi:peptidoglycan-associated lipoprotein
MTGRARALTTAALALVAAMLVLGLAGCGKKEQPVVTDPTPPPPVETQPVEVPKADIPVVETAPNPEDLLPPDLGLQPVFFDFDKFELSSLARETLNANGRILKELAARSITIEGHCDERGTAQYNLALGEKRARSAKEYLADLGVDPGRIEVVSYGKERPFEQGHSESAWAQNRRAHFVPRAPAK